jgi:hypothetical protein
MAVFVVLVGVSENQSMTETMRTVVKTRPEPGMSLETWRGPDPGSGDVQIRVESVGIDGCVEALIYD